MNTTDSALQTLLDIELPPPPPDYSAVIFITLCAVVISAIGLYLLRHRLWSQRARARRGLRRERALLRRGSLDGRSAAYRIAATLRAGLGLSCVSPSTPLPAPLATQRDRWERFVDTLHRARYSPAPCSAREQERLFIDAEFWLRRWP